MVLPFWFLWDPDSSEEKKAVGHKVLCNSVLRLRKYYNPNRI